MNMYLALLLLVGILVIGFVVLVLTMLHQTKVFLCQNHERTLAVVELQVEKTDRLLQKAISLLGTKDPLAFQAVVAMDSEVYSTEPLPDVSDEAEAERWLAEHPEGEELDDSLDRDALRELSDNSGPITLH